MAPFSQVLHKHKSPQQLRSKAAHWGERALPSRVETEMHTPFYKLSGHLLRYSLPKQAGKTAVDFFYYFFFQQVK